MESISNFKHFSVKDRVNVFRKLENVKDLVRPLNKKRRVITSLDSQHLKGSQTLVKSS